MKAAILKAQGGLDFREIPVPTPGPGEVLIKNLICGICSSDIGAYKNGLGEEYPLGHEVVGVVEALGPGAEGFAPGDRVTGTMLGGYGEYTLAPAAGLVKVPGKLKDEEAVIEPLVCLLSGLDRTLKDPGVSVAVVGTGYMGLALIRLLQIKGVKDITAVDIKTDLFGPAKEMGATRTLTPEQCEDSMFDIVYEVAGAPPVLGLIGRLCKPFGTLVLVGYYPYKMEMDITVWQAKALAIVNAFENRLDMQRQYTEEALQLVEQGLFPSGKLLTHHFTYEELPRGFEMHTEKPAGYLKSYVRIAER